MADQPTLGWECPKCARCYAPWVDRCYPCNNGEQGASGSMGGSQQADQVYPFDSNRHVKPKLTCALCGQAAAVTFEGVGQCCYGVTR